MADTDDDKHLVVLLPIIIYIIASVGGSVAYNFGVNESNHKNSDFSLNSTTFLVQNSSINWKNQSLNGIVNLSKSGNKTVPKNLFSSSVPKFIKNNSSKNTNSKLMKINESLGDKWNLSGTKTVYLTSDRVLNKKKDRKFLERIKFNLQKSGIRVIIDPWASNPDQVPRAIQNAPEGSAVIIVNYNCAGTIKDLGEGISGPKTNGNQNKGYLYDSAKNLTGIIYVNVSPNTFLTNSTYLPRAYDDQFSPESFEGIKNPSKYLLNNGIALVDSPKSDQPVMGVERADIISHQISELLKI